MHDLRAHCVHTFTMIKHSKLTSALDQLTTILASSSEEPLYTAVVEQCGTGGGTVGDHVNVNACAAAITTRSYTSKMYTHTTPVYYHLILSHTHTHTHTLHLQYTV